jgi:SAM-dependent methyltransferase
MKSPWLQIPSSDYEGHMLEVGQIQALNKITKEFLEAYKPSSFALLGCCTGNGLEHVDTKITSSVYAIDINPEYLAICEDRYASALPGLKTLLIDIEKEELPIKDIDVCFAGLVLEYVDPPVLIKNIKPVLRAGGVLAIVIQQSGKAQFVSKTEYKSLEKLSGVSHEIDENLLSKWMHDSGMKLLRRREVKLTDHKSFLILTYQKLP